MKPKVIRTSTIALSLDVLLKGQLKYLSQYFEVFGASGLDEHLTNVKERENIQVIDVSMERQISPLKDILSLVKLYKLFKKEKPDIVHSITPKAGLLSMMAAWFAGVPVRMHTFTGLIFPSKTGLLQKILIVMDKLLCACATNIYPEGEGVKRDLISFNITKKALKVLGNGNVNGIDVDYYKPDLFSDSSISTLRNSLGINSDDFVFIFIGRLVKDKGIEELITAFCLENNEHRNTKLLLVGPLESDFDPLSVSCLNEIKRNNNIIMVGFQKDVRHYLAISNALVFPSYREGFPNVPMQAGCLNLPSIVTDISGCNEIIKNEVNGLIIPVKDVSRLQIAMNRLVTDDRFYQSLKNNSRRMIVERYEQKHFWSLLLTEYREQLKSHGIVY